jgi:hypothetical protein
MKMNIKFEKEQSDQYFVILDNNKVGYFYCSNYYSSKPIYRKWIIVLEKVGSYKITDVVIGTIKSVKDRVFEIIEGVV